MIRNSFSELDARDRASALMDAGTYRELVGPWERCTSPYLELQGAVCQSDDGTTVARGQIGGAESVIVSIEGRFQGGSIGEVNGSKIAGALELALRDARQGRLIFPILLLDTGGIRVQEANLGLLAVSEIHSAILALRDYVPVIGVIAGKIGCFGGMGIAAGLCTTLIGTEMGRLGLNGPEVIEQEAGLGELDVSDRRKVWRLFGCRQRLEEGHIDILVEDSLAAVAQAVRHACAIGKTEFKSRKISHYEKGILEAYVIDASR
jgi:malonate decarboxylase beta subunit